MPEFLTVEDVLFLHARQIEAHGGDPGIRDMGLLESAVAQPQATFGGEYLHNDLFEQAAAYLFHIAGNHPFVDGNKRAGMAAALVFLDINGINLAATEDELYDLTIRVATGNVEKAEVAERLRRWAKAQ